MDNIVLRFIADLAADSNLADIRPDIRKKALELINDEMTIRAITAPTMFEDVRRDGCCCDQVTH